jgi:GTPase involved in cell partitioning and DNA repair
MTEQKLTGSFTVNSACVTTFSFQTNGYQGGDGGHGGYLEIVIDGHTGTMMNVAVDDEPMSQGGTGDRKVTIRFLGTAKCKMLQKVLSFSRLASDKP